MTSPARPLPLSFGDGIAAFLGGLAFVVRTPSVWLLALAPAMAAAILFVAFSSLGLLGLVRTWPNPAGQGFAWTLLEWTAGLAVLVAAFLLGQALAQPLAGPALDRIVRRQNEALGVATLPDPPLPESIGRSLKVTLVTLAVATPPLALASLVDFLIPPAAVVVVPLQFLFAALVATWNLVDYPFSLARVGVRSRTRWISEHLGGALGFGLCMAALGLIPFIGLLVLPVGVAGATRLASRADQTKP